jgi:two-component system sensor histidine kinase KdpD
VAAEYRWVHPSEIVNAARDTLARSLDGHLLELDIETDTPVRLDPRIASSALAHVLENAAQYAPAGSTITVTAAKTDEGLLLAVRDRGPGIAPGELPRLFERFYRGTTVRAHTSGTGMGLSIARGLLAALHGRIWAENCPDGGARFSMVIPVESRPTP